MNRGEKKAKRNVGLLCVVGVMLACMVGGLVYFIRSGNASDSTEAKKVVMSFLDSYRTKQPDTTKYLDYAIDTGEMRFEGFQGLIAEQIDYVIKDVKQQDDQFIVAVEIRNVDFKKVFNDVIHQLPSNATQEEILDTIERKMSDKNCAKRVFECEVIVVKGEKYKIAMTESLSNALLGGFNEYLTELTTGQEVSGNA